MYRFTLALFCLLGLFATQVNAQDCDNAPSGFTLIGVSSDTLAVVFDNPSDPAVPGANPEGTYVTIQFREDGSMGSFTSEGPFPVGILPQPFQSGSTPSDARAYAIDGLAENTAYEVQIFFTCGVTTPTTSPTAGPLTERTLCDRVEISSTVSYEEGFDDASGDINDYCVTTDDFNFDGATWQLSASASAASGTRGAELDAPAVSSNFGDVLRTRTLALSAGTEYQLQFYYGSSDNLENTDENLSVFYTEVDNLSNTNLLLLDSVIDFSTPERVSMVFTVPTSSDYYIGFNGNSASGQGTIFVDEISVKLYDPTPVGASTVANPDNSCNAYILRGVAGTNVRHQAYESTDDNRLLFEIAPNGNELKDIIVNVRDTSAVGVGENSEPNPATFDNGNPNPQAGLFNDQDDVFASRYFYINSARTSSLNFGGATARFYYLDGELAELDAVLEDDVTVPDLGLSQYRLLGVSAGQGGGSNINVNCDQFDNTPNRSGIRTQTGNGDYGDAFYVMVNLVRLVGEYALVDQSSGALPVELTRFEAVAAEQSNVLTWETATEEGTEVFEVQRSLDGKTFETIGEVRATGNSTVAQSYRFEDADLSAISYYRLSIVDFNGERELSEIVVVEREIKGVAVTGAFPVPVTSELTFTYVTAGAQRVQLQLTNMYGQVVATQAVTSNAGNNVATFDMSSMPSGVYNVSLVSGERVYTRRIVKQ